ncbi:ROK family protein [Enterococcus sp. BWR-S5]|uniref:ROK family protein n=1 Tax=Enterococcus sp. BWR-S5 TaxID=2787714 RepID=UPI00192312AF|nr:ROK family protein [Enterococcus sp. BWR-S5]MBL1226656.1 ROK family protein [Enterococcus sp. BWR-S5]
MGILAFDIGGSAVKYGFWEKKRLLGQCAVPLPKDWKNMKKALKDVYEEFRESYDITGVALSAPGLVNEAIGQIQGVSAVPYIHHFPIQQELSELFGVPVTMENDANCAALAEVWQGAAKESENCLFFVIGTGVGGSVIINRKLFKGSNLFGGEFGYMFLNDSASLSDLGSSVKAVKKYNRLTNKAIQGKELFELAEAGDPLAEEIAGQFYRAAATGIYNLLVCFDPGLVILGGGVSANPVVVTRIKKQLSRILLERSVTDMNYSIEACVFGNDANLIGAVYHHITSKEDR